MQVSEAQEMFRRYCARQALLTGSGSTPALTTSPSVKVGRVHMVGWIGTPAQPARLCWALPCLACAGMPCREIG